MPIYSPYRQGTSEWLRERVGSLTGSHMADAMSFLKNGREAEARKKLKIAIVAERLCNLATETYVTPQMEWGTMQEPFARQRYEELSGDLVEQCGFVKHDDILDWGCSPDGLINDDGLIEIKAPETATFVGWVAGGVVPPQHEPQMLAQLAICQRKYCIFFAFDPRIQYREHQHFLRRFTPPAEDIAAVEDAARKFLAEVEELFQRITTGGIA